MKHKKSILLLLGLLVMFVFVIGYSQPGKAAQKNRSITKTLVQGQSLDIFKGEGGVYFVSSNNTGKAILSRVEATNTKNLMFTHRWLDIQVVDSRGKEIKLASGYIYVYFNLNADDLAAWNKDKLEIYRYDLTKGKWVECPTYYIGSKSATYGRVSCLITQNFGRYALAIKR